MNKDRNKNFEISKTNRMCNLTRNKPIAMFKNRGLDKQKRPKDYMAWLIILLILFSTLILISVGLYIKNK